MDTLLPARRECQPPTATPELRGGSLHETAGGARVGVGYSCVNRGCCSPHTAVLSGPHAPLSARHPLRAPCARRERLLHPTGSGARVSSTVQQGSHGEPSSRVAPGVARGEKETELLSREGTSYEVRTTRRRFRSAVEKAREETSLPSQGGNAMPVDLGYCVSSFVFSRFKRTGRSVRTMTDSDQVTQEQFDALVERVETLEAQLEVATEGDSPEPDEKRDVSEDEQDDERETIEKLGGPWMGGSGAVVRRTNLTIAALLQQDFERFGVDQLSDAIRAIANVESDETVRKYRERVIEHGPFEKASRGLLWEIHR